MERGLRDWDWCTTSAYSSQKAVRYVAAKAMRAMCFPSSGEKTLPESTIWSWSRAHRLCNCNMPS
eukprot:715713-Heterocapsa_arctica.AAC.1